MTRIITPETNVGLKKEYTIRFFTLLFFVLTLVICTHIILGISSYFLLTNYEEIYKNNLNNANTEIVQQNKYVIEQNTLLSGLIKKIPNTAPTSSFEAYETIKKYAGADVLISAYEFFPEGKETKITIRGTSISRDALISFENLMRKDPQFKDFKIPLETLTKQKDIAFNATFTYYEKN